MATGRVAVTDRISANDRVAVTSRVAYTSRIDGMTNHIGNGLVGYYRADSENIILSTGKVSQWTDLSGNSRNMTQNSSIRRPTVTSNWINGVSAINFTSGTFLTSSPLQSTVNPWTMGGVLQSTNNAAARCILNANTNGGHALAINADGSGKRGIRVNGSSDCTDAAATTNIEVWIAVGAFQTGILTAYSLFTGVTATVQTITPAATGTVTPVGTNSIIGAISTTGTFPFIGNIGEIFFLNRLLSTEEISRYLAYVQVRYGNI